MGHATGLISRSFAEEFCSWRDCEEIADHPDHPLCARHYRRIGLLFIHEHIDVMRAVAGAPTTSEMLERIVREDPPEDRLRRQQVWAYEQAAKFAGSVVYYVRMGEFIKIGTTVNMPRRMLELYVAESDVLATEPGGPELEVQRHREFAEERHHRELFECSDRLMAHIERLARERE